MSARVAVLLGGASAEREVSRAGGARVVAALARLGHAPEALEVGPDLDARLRALAPDVVFNALHGAWGEDGGAQALCEWLGLPYTGSGLTGCAVSFDKPLSKALYVAAGLPTPAWARFAPRGADVGALLAACPAPLVLKPAREGSSVGVRLARDPAEAAEAVAGLAAEGVEEALAEAYVAGREFTVAVLGDRALPVVEILPAEGHAFFTREAKYAPGGCRHVAPAALDAATAERLRALGLAAHRALRLRDYSRTDVLLDAAGSPWLLETNALPGLTERSLLPDAAAADGLAYDALIGRILGFALARRTAGGMETAP